MSLRRVFTASAGYSLVGFVERGLALVLLPITTRIFQPSDVAQLIAIANITALAGQTIGMGLLRALPAMLARQPEGPGHQAAGATILWGTAAASLAMAIAGWLAAPWLTAVLKQPESFTGLLRLGLAAMLAVALGYGLTVLARTLERHSAAIGIQAVGLIVQTGLLLGLLLGAGLGVASVLWASLAYGLIMLVAHLAIVDRRWLATVPQARPLGDAAKLSAHLLALSAGPMIMLNCAGLILNAAGRPEEAALYSIASGAAGVMLLSAGAFEGVWTAYVLKRRDAPELAPLAVRVFELHSAVLVISAAAGALFAHEVLSLLVGPRFVPAYALVPPLAGCYGLLALAQNFAQGLMLGERPERRAWIGLVTAAIYVLGGGLAAVTFGVAGLLAAMAVALVLLIALSQWASFTALPIGYPWRRHGALWLAAAAAVGWVAYLPLGWRTALVKLAVLAAVTAAALAVAGLDWRGVRHVVGRIRTPEGAEERSP